MQDGLLLKQPIVKIVQLFDSDTPLAVFFKIILLRELHGKNKYQGGWQEDNRNGSCCHPCPG
jgi:hypothetical protein